MSRTERIREIYKARFPVGTVVTTYTRYEDKLFWEIAHWDDNFWEGHRVEARLIGIHPDIVGSERTSNSIGNIEKLAQEQLKRADNPLLVLALMATP